MDGDELWDIGPVNYDDDCDGDGMPNWYESGYGVANQGWQNPYIYNARYGVLIGGGGVGEDAEGKNKKYPAFEKDLKEMYDKLKGYGYTDENIYCLLWDKSAGYLSGRVDGPATWYGSTNTIRKSIEEIGTKITINDFFYFTEIGHGWYTDSYTDSYFNVVDGMAWDGGNVVEYSVYFGGSASPSDRSLKQVLDTHIGTHYARSLFVFQSCKSGYAIDYLDGSNRIVISATNKNQPAWTWKLSIYSDARDHWEFLHNDKGNGFTYSLGSSTSCVSIGSAYNSGYSAAQDEDLIGKGDWSTPQINNKSMADNTYL